jgi:hypothetical protein
VAEYVYSVCPRERPLSGHSLTENSIVVPYKNDDRQRKKVSPYRDGPLFITFQLKCLEDERDTLTVYTPSVHLPRTMGPLTEKENNYPLVLLNKTCHNRQKENLLERPMLSFNAMSFQEK